MLGERLQRANRIARKRMKRWAESELPLGRYRKWNQTCGCPICRKDRYSRKGKHNHVEV